MNKFIRYGIWLVIGCVGLAWMVAGEGTLMIMAGACLIGVWMAWMGGILFELN